YDAVPRCLLHVYFGYQHLLIRCARFDNGVAVEIDHSRAPDETPSALCANSVSGDEVNVILVCANVYNAFGGAVAGRPVHRQDYQFGPEKLQDAGGFRKVGIIANIDSHLSKGQAVDLEGVVARRQEPLYAGKRHVYLPVVGHRSGGTDQDRRIVVLAARFFYVSVDGVNDFLPAYLGNLLSR